MEQEYVIGVTNRYALFLEESSHEEDPFEIIKNAEAEKTKKKTLKTVSGESKENKGKPDPKAKPAVTPARKSQGIKETQNVKPVESGAVTKTKPQDGALKNNKPAPGGRKGGDKPQGERTAPAPDKTVKFNTGEPQNERPGNRRQRDDKPGERNGDGGRNRNFREDGAPKGNESESGQRPSRNSEDSQRPPRRGDGDRPFRGGDRDRERNDRQLGDGENRPARREPRERREFQERDFARDGAENGDARPDRRPNALLRSKGGRQGGGGGGPGGRNFDNRGKREFERKSGSDKTGVKAVDKREGGGAHNWGNPKDDLDETSAKRLGKNPNIRGVIIPKKTVSNNLNTTNLSEDNPDWEKPNENNVSGGEGKEGEGNEPENEIFAVAEEEPKELTLDEYRAMRGKRELPQYNLRKAGEGEDLSQWKNMYEIKKKRDSEEPEEEELGTAENPQRAGRQRQVLDIDITFSDARRGPRGARGGRAPRTGLNATPGGGRNRQRGDGPRRGQREERGDFAGGRGGDREFSSRGNHQSAPKVDDEHDFPSLG